MANYSCILSTVYTDRRGSKRSWYYPFLDLHEEQKEFECYAYNSKKWTNVSNRKMSYYKLKEVQPTASISVTNLGVIWLNPHNFLLWSHGRLLSMKSLVRVLPAAAYTFNMVPIYDPGGPNPHGRVWGPFPVPVRDFTPRSHYPREAGLPKPDSDPAPDSLGIGLSPNSSQKYTVLYLELIRSLLDPFQGSHTIIGTSDSFRLPLTHSELPWLGLSLGMFHKVHGPVPWTNPCTIRSFSGVPHYYWDVGLL